MLFNVVGHFKPGAAAETGRVSGAFTEHLKQQFLRIPLAGQLLDAKGEEIGFMALIEAENRAQVEDFVRESPNVTEGLYESVEVCELDVEIGRAP